MDINNFKKSIKAGEVIIKVGDLAEHTFILLSGEVEIKKDDRVIATISKSGSFIGEIAALLNETRSADVVTSEDCDFIVVSNNEFKKLIKLDPEIGVRLAKSLAQRLRDTTKLI